MDTEARAISNITKLSFYALFILHFVFKSKDSWKIELTEREKRRSNISKNAIEKGEKIIRKIERFVNFFVVNFFWNPDDIKIKSVKGFDEVGCVRAHTHTHINLVN